MDLEQNTMPTLYKRLIPAGSTPSNPSGPAGSNTIHATKKRFENGDGSGVLRSAPTFQDAVHVADPGESSVKSRAQRCFPLPLPLSI